MTTKKEAQKELVTTIKTTLLERLKFDDKGEVTGDKDSISKAYADCLPEGLTMKEVQAVHDYDTAFVAGVAATASSVAKVLGENKDLDNVTYEVPTHNKGKVQVMATREELSVGVTTTITNPKAGELKGAFNDFYAAMQAFKEE